MHHRARSLTNQPVWEQMDFKMDALEKRFNVRAEEEPGSDAPTTGPAASLSSKPSPPTLTPAAPPLAAPAAAAPPVVAAPPKPAAPAPYKPALVTSKPVPPTLQASAKPASAFKRPTFELDDDPGGTRGPINPVLVSKLPPPLPREAPPPPNPNASGGGGGAREARPDSMPSSSADARAKLVAAMSGGGGGDDGRMDLGMVRGSRGSCRDPCLGSRPDTANACRVACHTPPPRQRLLMLI
jgi:hypothetical protein